MLHNSLVYKNNKKIYVYNNKSVKNFFTFKILFLYINIQKSNKKCKKIKQKFQLNFIEERGEIVMDIEKRLKNPRFYVKISNF